MNLAILCDDFRTIIFFCLVCRSLGKKKKEFVVSHVKDRVAKWAKELDSLVAIALT